MLRTGSITLFALACALAAAAASRSSELCNPFTSQNGNVQYNGKFTFTRVRYNGPGYGFRGGSSWAHDYPQADVNLPEVMSEISRLRPNLDASNVFDLEDATIFQHPILYLSEPGFWGITEAGARNLRAYLLKGGFIIFDDFEAEQWHNFEAQFRRALPEAQFIPIDVKHPIFHTFFDLQKLDTPHPLVRVTPIYYGVFEDNDPTGRMLAMVNYNADLAEYWEWSGSGFFAIEPTNDAYKMGVNYILYGLTH